MFDDKKFKYSIDVEYWIMSYLCTCSIFLDENIYTVVFLFFLYSNSTIF